jgi:beta-glucanase (GH16 family)
VERLIFLEYVGRTRYGFTSLHTQDSHGNTINTKKTRFEDIEDGYHIYAMDWSKDKIDFFLSIIIYIHFQSRE